MSTHTHSLRMINVDIVRQIIVLLLLGFSAGIPILLIFSTLSLWLNEAGVAKSTVTFFSWAALGYSFKFVWAPIVDKVPLPFLARILGRRRSWLLLSQLMVCASLVLMAANDPAVNLVLLAYATVLLGFSSATQDIVIDAYRIEYADPDRQALLSSCYVAGYRIGMIVAGAGALYLADFFGTSKADYSYLAWQKTYWAMCAVMLIGIATTLFIREPNQQNQAAQYPYPVQTYIKFFVLFLVSVLAFVIAYREIGSLFKSWSDLPRELRFILGMLRILLSVGFAGVIAFIGAKFNLADKQLVTESYWLPVYDFFKRYGKLAIGVLFIIGFYRVSDIFMGVIANIFYQDIGYSKTDIASLSKVFGVLMTIAGSFAGGFLALRYKVINMLIVGIVLSAISNFAFIWLAQQDASYSALGVVIAIDNLSAGLATAAFIAWLSSLTSIEFTAVQYAVFSSLMTLFPKFLGGYAGTIVEATSYEFFFALTALVSLPIIVVIIYLRKKIA